MTPRCGSLLSGGALLGHHLPIEPGREVTNLLKERAFLTCKGGLGNALSLFTQWHPLVEEGSQATGMPSGENTKKYCL
jgi:hypothetical protein